MPLGARLGALTPLTPACWEGKRGEGSTRAPSPQAPSKYLLTGQIDHSPQQLDQLSLVGAQPRPIGTRGGPEEDDQVVGRRRHDDGDEEESRTGNWKETRPSPNFVKTPQQPPSLCRVEETKKEGHPPPPPTPSSPSLP